MTVWKYSSYSIQGSISKLSFVLEAIYPYLFSMMSIRKAVVDIQFYSFVAVLGTDTADIKTQ